MYRASSLDVRDEWLELHNTTAAPVNLAGWRFTDGVDFTFPAGSSLAAGQRVVIAADLARFQSQYPGVSNVVGGWQRQLGNNGDTLRLEDAAGNVQDELSYGSEGDWALRRAGPLDAGHTGWIWTTPADAGGSSLELVNPALDNANGQNWRASTATGGTPGAANSVASANAAPLVSQMQQFPLVPRSNDAVTIRALVTDELATGTSATLYWRLDGAPAFTAEPMFDDGAHGDGGAGDGIFAVSLPAQPNNTVVEYYLSAADAGGNTRTWPGPTDDLGTQGANLLYQVDDSPAYTGNQPIFKLIMTEAERAELAAIGAGAGSASNAQMNATFIATDGAGTEVRYSVGVRNRGEGSRNEPPNNYRVNLPNDRRWRDLAAMNFNSHYSSLEVIGSAVLRQAGVHAQDAIPVQVRVNNANLASPTQFDMFGSYSMVEVEDGDMVESHFPTDDQGNYYRGRSTNGSANLNYLGETPSLYFNNYPKQTNSDANDYSDLIDLTKAFSTTQTPDAQFVQRITDRIDVDGWLRYFAASQLLGNQENSLATGTGDDFALYRGLNDTRFKLVAHDLDTLLGRGDTAGVVDESIFSATGVTTINRFLKHPAFAPRFNEIVRELATTIFAAENFNPLVDNTLGSYVPEVVRQGLKDFAAARVANVLGSQVITGVTAASSLTVTNGYPRTTSATTSSLSGRADPVLTRSVLVNGQPATWTQWQGNWTASNVALRPGINRVVVQALNAQGQEIGRTFIDVWRDTGTTTAFSGTLPAGTTTWTPTGGPYRVSANLIVPAGATLVIQPGTTVFFDTGFNLTVNGRLVAEGTDLARIRFTRTPTSTGSWGGIRFSYATALPTASRQDNRITFADIEYGGGGSESILMSRGNLLLDNVRWASIDKQYVDVTDSNLILSNSVLPDISTGELVHFSGFPSDGYARIQGNVFGKTSSYNDIIDFTGGQRPGPIAQFLDNTFLGGPDDGIDMDGTDAHVEGNVFMNFHQDAPRDSKSHAVSTGEDGGNVSEITIVRNFFYDVDHAILIKSDSFGTIVNNTIVNVYKKIADATTAAINLYEPRPGQWPAGGVYLDGNIFQNISQLFENPETPGYTTTISVNRSIFPQVDGERDWKTYGVGNSNADPHLLNPTSPTDLRRDLALRPGPGPAVGTGPNGVDIGAAVPAGASISGEPFGTTWRTDATLSIGGPHIYAYKYRINGGAWSAPVAVTNPGQSGVSIPPIVLSSLTNGSYTVQVVAQNTAGAWQPDADATSSRTWTVDAATARLLINEVLASSDNPNQPDLIELHNDGPATRDLSGMSISDNPASPRKFVFPAGTTIPAGGFLVLKAGDPDGSGGIFTGFALDKDGEGVWLYDTLANGGVQLDAVAFGSQLPDYSIGRRADGAWGLSVPTFGSANVVAPVGDPAMLRINEWLTDGFPPFNDDFVELFNSSTLPVPMGGLYLTDNPNGWPDRSPIPALSFMPARGYFTFIADGNAGPGHADFKLAHEQGMIGLLDADLNVIDSVVYGSQRAGVSQGLVPDGGNNYGFFQQPNPGVSNPAPTNNTQLVNHNLLGITDAWRYHQSADLGTAWQATDYVDSGPTAPAGWSSGGGLLYVEGSALPAPKTTPLTIGRITYYFRTHFTLPVDPATLTSFQLQTVLDDGAIIYINGVEALRIGMPTDAVTYDTRASRNVDNAGFEGPFLLPTTNLVQGDNVIAVEVHQTSSGSSDVVWGATLSATALVEFTPPPPPPIRIVEINYNPPGGGAYTSQDYEYLELKNTGTSAVDLSGMQFTAGISATLGTYSLEPGAVAVLVRNPTAFTARYGAGVPIAGTFSGALSDEGEQLRLLAADGATILDFSYSNTWFPQTDGNAYALNIIDPLADTSTWSSPASWRASLYPFGSPGIDEPSTAADAIVVNELLTHSHGAAGDWVEFYNSTAAPIDIGGWYLTDSAANLLKYQVPSGKVIPAQGYLVLTEADDFGGAFAFSEMGEQVWLSASATPGVLSGFRTGLTFGAADSDVTLGRYVTSTGQPDFPQLLTPTPGLANSAPRVGPIVINEVMYHPAGIDSEYIELRNITGAAVDLYDPANPQNTWQFTAGLTFAFPTGSSIPANGYALVVPGDPTAFRSTYNIPASVGVFGPYTGALDNSGETLELSKPGTPEAGVTPYVVVDRVVYGNAAPWPALANGSGAALSRLNSAVYGNDPVNWAAEAPAGSRGVGNFAPVVSSVLINDGSAQRSMVSWITVTFDRAVTLGVGAFTLAGRDGAGAGTVLGWSNPSSDGMTWKLEFSGAPIIGSSLADGIYDLTIVASQVLDLGGAGLAADHSIEFHRLYSDADGDGDSDNADLFQMRSTYGKFAGDSAYKWHFDYENDGDVDNADIFQVRSRRAKVFQNY